MNFLKRFSAIIIFTLYLFSYISCVSFGAASAEEYYTIGMAYFEMGKFAEAEQWLNRAQAADKTKTASEYNLGRIAFETGRYKDAAAFFDKVLAKDPVNLMALKAAAYTRIKTGEIETAEKLYQRVLDLVGDSADDGYNYALVLYALKKYAAAEELIANRQYALLENKDMLLLYARTQKVQNKVEAVDSYAKWLVDNKDPKVRYEYAQVLEKAELYARALEECRTALTELNDDTRDPAKGELRYAIARLIFIADPENPEGMTELKGAIADGYNDFDAMEKLALDEKLSAVLQGEIRAIIDDAKRTEAEKKLAAAKEAEARKAAALEGDELILPLPPEAAFLSEAPGRISGGTMAVGARAPLVYRNYLENSGTGTSSLMPIDWARNSVVFGRDGPYPVKDEELSSQVLAAEFVLDGEKTWTGFEVRLGDGEAIVELAKTMEVPFRLYDFSDAAPSFTLILQFGVLSDQEKGLVENPSLLVEKQLYPPPTYVPDNPSGFSTAGRIGTIELDDSDRQKLKNATHLRLLVISSQSGQLSGRVLLGNPVILKK